MYKTTAYGENWIEITIRRFEDRSYSVRSANMRREKYTNRITFKGGLPLEEALSPSICSEVLRMTELVSNKHSVQEFPDFYLEDRGMKVHGCSMLAGKKGTEFQQFMMRLNSVSGQPYGVFAQGLVEEPMALASPESIVDLVRLKVVEPVNKLSSVFESYDKETTFAIIPAYFSVLKRLMNTRLEKLEVALSGGETLRLEHKADRPDSVALEVDALAEPKRITGGK